MTSVPDGDDARDAEGLVRAALSGDRRATSRLLTLMEQGGPEARRALMTLYPRTGQAYVVGITGPPGTGKSTLATEMARVYRTRDMRVGIIAVDPTSPFSGGALLGDRIRMRDLAMDPNVFIRSMATRGSLGGLAVATADVAHVLDAAGYAIILVETVGAGQSEVDIARLAHTTVVVQMPAAGDEIQAIKAGILEIADVLVVNKADLAGADNAVAALQAMLDLNSSQGEHHHGHLPDVPETVVSSAETPARWRPPVLRTCALRREGIDDLLAAIERHRQYQNESGSRQARDRERAQDELQRVLRRALLQRVLQQIPEGSLERVVERIAARECDPYSAADEVIGAAGLR